MDNVLHLPALLTSTDLTYNHITPLDSVSSLRPCHPRKPLQKVSGQPSKDDHFSVGSRRNSTNHPNLVLWAQRSSNTDAEKNIIYLTISATDVSKIDVDLKPTSLTFTGHSETKKTTYHVKLDFYSEIDVENSKTNHTSRDVEFVLRKKESKDEYWPRLLKDSARAHFLKTDFDKVSLGRSGSCHYGMLGLSLTWVQVG